MKINDYRCKPDENDFGGVDVSGFAFPQAHYELELFVKLARFVNSEYGFTVVPFCNTVEAENVGAKVILADGSAQSRIREAIFEKFEEITELENFNYETGRLRVLMDAVKVLKEDEKPVMVKMTGPYTFFSLLTDSTEVMKASRKAPEVEKIALKYLLENHLEFAKRLDEAGAQFVSLADPTSGVSIVGPKVLRNIIEQYTLPLVEAILSQTSLKVYLCPKFSIAMRDLGYISRRRIDFAEPKFFHTGVSECGERLFGDRCYKLNIKTKGLNVYDITGGSDE